MNLKQTTRIVVGLLALAAAGSAFANTTIADGETGNGSIFLNVVDTTNLTSFVFDTGLHLNAFDGNASQSFNLAADANWQTFITGAGADQVQFNVVGINSQGSSNTYNAVFTSNAVTGTQVGRVGSTSNGQLQGVANLNPFISAINLSATSSTRSLFVADTGANANDAAYFGSNFSMGSGFAPPGASAIKTLQDVGTAQKFYKIGLNGDGSQSGLKALVTTYAGVWNLAGGLLSYTVAGGELPLPDSLGLLLAGLALMGVIARRAKSSGAGDTFMGAAA